MKNEMEGKEVVRSSEYLMGINPKGNYSEVLESLYGALNCKVYKGASQVFKDAINNLENKFGVQISTKFLKSLLNSRTSVQRINYLLRSSGYTTMKKLRFYDSLENNSYKTKIIQWDKNKWGEIIQRTSEMRTVGNFRKMNKKEVMLMIVKQEIADKLKSNMELLSKQFKPKIKEVPTEAVKEPSENFVKVNCGNCKTPYRFRLPKKEMSHWDKFAWSITQSRMSDLTNGIAGCSACDEE